MRKQFKPGELTPRQKELLLYGQSSLTGRGFVNEDEELAGWIGNRDALLAAAGSAGRPCAYVKFELCEAEPEWIGDLQVLFDRGFLPAPRETATLAADQPDDLHAEFETVESIRAIGLRVSTLESICREMGHVLAYQTYRGRPALIEKYSGIHAAIRTVLRETLVPLIPPKKETFN